MGEKIIPKVKRGEKWKKKSVKKCVKVEIIGMLRKCGAGADKYVWQWGTFQPSGCEKGDKCDS